MHFIETEERSRNDGEGECLEGAPLSFLKNDQLSPPSPGIKGKSERLWQTASGLTPALEALGPEGRLVGKAAAALREPCMCHCPARWGHAALASFGGALSCAGLGEWASGMQRGNQRKGKTPSTRTKQALRQSVALSLMSCGRLGNPLSLGAHLLHCLLGVEDAQKCRSAAHLVGD